MALGVDRNFNAPSFNSLALGVDMSFSAPSFNSLALGVDMSFSAPPQSIIGICIALHILFVYKKTREQNHHYSCITCIRSLLIDKHMKSK